jgi:hypothetical protein
MPSLFVIHLFHLPAGGISPGQKTSPENNIYSKVGYTNTQQDLPVKGHL